MIKKLFISAAFLFFFSILLFPQEKPVTNNTNQLLGKWTTVEEPGQITSVSLDFQKNDSIEYRETVRITGSYLFDGKNLVTFFMDERRHQNHVDTISTIINGNSLLETIKKPGRLISIKSMFAGNKKHDKGLIGKWYTDNYNHYKAYQTFTNDHTLYVDLIVKDIKGKYKDSKNEFTITSAGAPVMAIKYSVNKDIMTIRDPHANEPMNLKKR